MSHWERKQAGEIVNRVRDLSERLSDAGQRRQLQALETRALDAERSNATGSRTIAALQDELCTACKAESLCSCSDQTDRLHCTLQTH